jgi:hypothetical protein
MGTGKVVVGYCSPGEVRTEWHESLLNLIARDAQRPPAERVIVGRLGMTSSANIASARNTIAAAFLKTAADWLFMTDADMVFEPDTVDRLLAAADPERAPIVGGLCFGVEGDQLFPTLYDVGGTPDAPEVLRYGEYPPDSLFRVFATGAACLLIHRSALERIRDFRENGRGFSTVFPWFQETTFRDGAGRDVMPMSEDVTFCWRAGVVGLPVHVHTGVPVGHVKPRTLTEALFLQQVAEPPPPATERTAVIVPVMRRPQNAEPFMRSLRASTGLARVVAVADLDDAETARAWERAGADVVERAWGTTRPRPGTFAEKVNACLAHAGEPWLFLTGDDVRFRAGWLDHAQAVAGEKYHVIGTNDLGNAAVMAGEHATHLLVRRSYVDEVGASWDGPGVVAHEGYRHWWVDNEIVTAAKQRGVWAMALGSHVEHLHPLWGKAPDDDVYRLGQASRDADRALFEARVREHAAAS